MAALLHYFLLSVFTWMFNHGVLLYLLIIKAELRDNIHSKMKWFYTFGWGKRNLTSSFCVITPLSIEARRSVIGFSLCEVNEGVKTERSSLPTHTKNASLSFCEENTRYHIVYVL